MSGTTPQPSASDAAAIDRTALTRSEQLLEILERAGDLATWNSAHETLCRSWLDEYLLGWTRANLVRGLSLATDGRVLELGARAGAVTRHLGEAGAHVEAMEPDPDLVTVARARCRGLESVTVTTGWIEDLPPEPLYDLILAIDPMDHLDRTGTSLETFVDQCRDRLSLRGTLVLALDNAEGVRFLAGDGVPSLGRSGDRPPARLTLDDAERAVAASGLLHIALSAFPDHRTPQVLFQPEMLTVIDPTLLTKLPRFPSPSYLEGQARPDAEEGLWRSFVEAGTAASHANGIVIVAGRETPATPEAAVYWSVGREPSASACNRVRVEDGSTVVVREPALPECPPRHAPIHLRPHTEPYVVGMSLTSTLRDASDLGEVQRLLLAWAELVRSSTTAASAPWDLIPRNVVMTPDGSLHAIDQEWEAADITPDSILDRGCFWLAHDLLHDGPVPRWLIGTTVGSAADFLRRVLGGVSDRPWLDEFLDAEADTVSYIWPNNAFITPSVRARQNRKALSNQAHAHVEGTGAEAAPVPSPASIEVLTEVVASLTAANTELRQQIEAMKIEQRRTALVHRDHAIGLTAEAELLKDRLRASQKRYRSAREQVTSLQTRLKEMRNSTSWRVGQRVVRPLSAARRKR